jgi:hypothetical protein
MLVVYSPKKMADAPRVPQFIENLGAGKFLGGIPNDLIVWVPIAIFLIFVLRRTDATAAGMPDGTFEWGGRRFIKKGQRIKLENRTTLLAALLRCWMRFGCGSINRCAFSNNSSSGTSWERRFWERSRCVQYRIGNRFLPRISGSHCST